MCGLRPIGKGAFAAGSADAANDTGPTKSRPRSTRPASEPVRRVAQAAVDGSGHVDFYRESGNAALTWRRFGISRQTFYRWQRRYDPLDLSTLEERSHSPRRRRQSTWSFPLEEKVLQLRLQFPRWGKDKLVRLLGSRHSSVSTSMVGRILAHLKPSTGW